MVCSPNDCGFSKSGGAGTGRDGVRLSAWLPFWNRKGLAAARCPDLKKARPGPKVPRLKRGMPRNLGGVPNGFPAEKSTLERHPLWTLRTKATQKATPFHRHGHSVRDATRLALPRYRSSASCILGFSTGPNFTIWFEF